MELEVEMSSLEISHKKRRMSGLFIKPPVTDDSNKECSRILLETIDLIKGDPSKESPEGPKAENPLAALRRSSRKRSATEFWVATVKDEKIVTTVKSLSLDENPKEIEKLYLNRTIKRLTPSLETIFEVPENKKVMSSRKFRRALNFNNNHTNNRHKTKKRVLKAKQITKHVSKEKITMSFLMQKLADIEADD